MSIGFNRIETAKEKFMVNANCNEKIKNERQKHSVQIDQWRDESLDEDKDPLIKRFLLEKPFSSFKGIDGDRHINSNYPMCQYATTEMNSTWSTIWLSLQFSTHFRIYCSIKIIEIRFHCWCFLNRSTDRRYHFLRNDRNKSFTGNIDSITLIWFSLYVSDSVKEKIIIR